MCARLLQAETDAKAVASTIEEMSNRTAKRTLNAMEPGAASMAVQVSKSIDRVLFSSPCVHARFCAVWMY